MADIKDLYVPWVKVKRLIEVGNQLADALDSQAKQEPSAQTRTALGAYWDAARDVIVPITVPERSRTQALRVSLALYYEGGTTDRWWIAPAGLTLTDAKAQRIGTLYKTEWSARDRLNRLVTA